MVTVMVVAMAMAKAMVMVMVMMMAMGMVMVIPWTFIKQYIYTIANLNHSIIVNVFYNST